MNRLQFIQEEFTRGPVANMQLLLSSLTPSGIVPERDKYYVFVYKAKTKNITYDRHPLVAVSEIYKWGFSGYNFHWEQYRRYSWNEVVSNLYEIYDEELNIVKNINMAKFITN